MQLPQEYKFFSDLGLSLSDFTMDRHFHPRVQASHGTGQIWHSKWLTLVQVAISSVHALCPHTVLCGPLSKGSRIAWEGPTHRSTGNARFLSKELKLFITATLCMNNWFYTYSSITTIATSFGMFHRLFRDIYSLWVNYKFLAYQSRD